MVVALLLIGLFGGMLFGAWWCLRQYYQARKKGYHALLAATIVLGVILAQFFTVLAGITIFDISDSSDTAAVIVCFLLFVSPSLMVTAVVAMLPPRPRRAGPRRSKTLSSSISRVLENGLAAVVVIGCFVSIYMLTISPGSSSSGVGTLGQFLGYLILLPAIGATVLYFARTQLDTAGLAEVTAADVRPAVLYVRAFQDELKTFAYVSTEESPRYTRLGIPIPTISFEQYLGSEFDRQIGPFVALGNPFDWVPPQGAARSYTPDEDWQEHFLTYAADAAAIVMDGSRSDDLYWELAEIVRNDWQTKLFFLTAPAPLRRNDAGFSLILALQQSAKGIRRISWDQYVEELNDVGLCMPLTEPVPGSVITFDATGRAEVLTSYAQQPEEFVTAIRIRL